MKDKTNREGLIEEGRALEDFIGVLQIILRYLRKKPFAQYLIDKKRRNEIDQIKRGRPSELIEAAKKQFSDDEKALKFFKSFERSYVKEKRTFEDRIHKTENLAAVGLSIETASHDVMLLIGKVVEQQESLIKELMLGEEIDRESLISRLTLIRGTISMIQSQMKDVQLLFPSTKSKTKSIDVKTILDKVHNLYKRAFRENHISVDYDTTTCPLVVKTTSTINAALEKVGIYYSARVWYDKARQLMIENNVTQIPREKVIREKKERKRRKIKYCSICGKEMSPRAKGCLCKNCLKGNPYSKRIDFPDKEQLRVDTASMSFQDVGRKYGVSGNAIRKWCKYYDLPYRKLDMNSKEEN